MRDTHADRRDAKRNKKRYGMRVSNKAAHLHQYLMVKRAKEAKDERTREGRTGGARNEPSAA